VAAGTELRGLAETTVAGSCVAGRGGCRDGGSSGGHIAWEVFSGELKEQLETTAAEKTCKFGDLRPVWLQLEAGGKGGLKGLAWSGPSTCAVRYVELPCKTGHLGT
jgi:hypothetical protein